jgi:hypothetical protein
MLSELAPPPRGPSTYWRTEPDLDLIKQVEQVTISALERPAWRFAAISERGDQRRGQSPRISDLAITALTVVRLQKQPGAASATGLRRGSPAMLPAVPRTGPYGLPSCCSAAFAEADT